MKKIISIFLYTIGVVAPMTLSAQGLQVTPPASSTNKTVVIPHSIYPASFIISEPQIISIDLNESGDKIAKIQLSSGITSLIITDIKSGKESIIKNDNITSASQVHFINDQFIALRTQRDISNYEIIELSSAKVLCSLPSNKYIGSTSTDAYFSNFNSSGSTIEKLDIAAMKISNVGNISGEIFGWYFSKVKGIVGVGVHSNMLSNIYSFENNKIGKSLFEFSSNFYFETKGCNNAGDVLYGITNFQSYTTYSCAISKTGIKPINNKEDESCTDIFISGNDVVLTTSIINASEYQESKNSTVVKALNFARESFKGSSIQIIDFIEKNNSLLFSIQGETVKPRYFVQYNNSTKPVFTDNCDGKNLTFISSEIAQLQTSEQAPQNGRMYLPTKADKATYPLVIYIPNNIFLPYANQFNPVVQHLCQNGFAVFVWNTRYASRSKDGFSYSDLVVSIPEDILLVNDVLKKEYPIVPESSFIVGEGLGGYLALYAGSSKPEVTGGIVVNGINFPGKEYSQDLLAVRMFGEDAQSKWSTLDRMVLSEKVNYLFRTNTKSNTERRWENANRQKNIKWTEITSDNVRVDISSKDLDGIVNWLKHLTAIEPQIFDKKPNVELKKK